MDTMVISEAVLIGGALAVFITGMLVGYLLSSTRWELPELEAYKAEPNPAPTWYYNSGPAALDSNESFVHYGPYYRVAPKKKGRRSRTAAKTGAKPVGTT